MFTTISKIIGNKTVAQFLHSKLAKQLSVVLMLMLLPLTVFVAQKTQEIRQRAAETECNTLFLQVSLDKVTWKDSLGAFRE